MRQVARELGVQYVLEGSLQIDGDQARITAQLIDGATGNHVWAERYDRPLDDVFVVQDEVTKKIAGTLAPSMGGVLTQAGRESARRKPPRVFKPTRITCWIEHKHRFTEEDNQKALELLTKAIELDPGFARAYVGLALAHSVAIDNGWTTSRSEYAGRHVEGAPEGARPGSVRRPGAHGSRLSTTCTSATWSKALPKPKRH